MTSHVNNISDMQLFRNEIAALDPTNPIEKRARAQGLLAQGMSMRQTAQQVGVTEGTIRRAIIHGSVMASFNVEEFSCDRLRRLTHPEIEARVEGFRKLTQF